MSEDPIHRDIHENFLAAIPRVGALSARSAVERIGPWLLVATGEPGFQAGNAAATVGAATEDDLDVAIRWFEARGSRPNFRLREPHDDALVADLKSRGFEPELTEPALFLARPNPPLYQGRLRISSVESDEDIAAYGSVNWPGELRDVGVAIARTANALGFDLLLGTLDGLAVACSMAVTTGKLVGVYNVAVEEPYRRQGFGEAISWAAVEAGQRRGAKDAWLGASAMGLSLYEQMGFRRVFAYEHLVRGGGE